ncbi:MAG: hypothetical protein WAO69_09260 [Aestuariivita sp.]|uniref:hypothetical protein n=1 Tax=Aestuariivita sp. TaxID=1872407 RepID=UPI003BB11D64
MRVEPHEKGRLHVFAVNRTRSEIASVFRPPDSGPDRLQPPAALLAELTGAQDLDPAGAELILLADLEGLGLSGYLTEGHDIPQSALSGDLRRLDALEGYALILSSRAFQGNAFALGKTADLTHIASFDQPGSEWAPHGAIASEAAKPYSAPSVPPRVARQRAQRLGGLIFAAVMLALCALVWILLT